MKDIIFGLDCHGCHNCKYDGSSATQTGPGDKKLLGEFTFKRRKYSGNSYVACDKRQPHGDKQRWDNDMRNA